MYLTYQYRIRSSSAERRLDKISYKVNYVWNYFNGLAKQNWRSIKQGNQGHFLKLEELTNLSSGASKDLGLDSQIIQEIAKTYIDKKYSENNKKKFFLRFRKYKKSLGWIPFKNQNIISPSVQKQSVSTITVAKKSKPDDSFQFCGKTYRYFKSRNFPPGAKLKCGSFSQDAKRNWYVNFVLEIPEQITVHPENPSKVGIDLGIKTIATLSDGSIYTRENLTKKYEDKLAALQQGNKKRQVRNLHHKIKNIRKDFTHKMTTSIVNNFVDIRVGDVKSSDIIENLPNSGKSVNDASWYSIKTQLHYKAIKQGGVFREVNEAYTTQDCSSCHERTGPRGKEGLNIRAWTCSKCGVVHDRDVNSAINISNRN